MDFSVASFAGEGEEIVAGRVVVRDRETQQNRTVDLRLRWLMNAQKFEIVGVVENQ
jgi:hypothetical protein